MAIAPTAATASIAVFDGVLDHPEAYRAAALALPYGSVAVGPDTFHGIALAPDETLQNIVRRQCPGTEPWLSFFRRSPEGQVEPNDVHSDAGMGDWTGILYLNPHPPAADGTLFWRHLATGAVSGEAWVTDGQDRTCWERVARVAARFNRLVVFAGPRYHSRALRANYGQDPASARLIQVVFARCV